MPHARLRHRPPQSLVDRPVWKTAQRDADHNTQGTCAPQNLQFPLRAIPAEHLLKLRDVFRKKVVEENPLLPIHHALIWHNISVLAAYRTERIETEKRKNGSKRFALFVFELFKFHDLHLLARKEFEEPLKLPGIESPIDVSKTAHFGWRRTRDARFLFSHGIEEIQRLAASKSLHVPMRKGALDGITQENEQFDFRVVLPNPLRRWFVINVTWCAITGDT